ncbi:uncharacterized protein LOC144235924 isoform X4 [Crocuta crocuta]
MKSASSEEEVKSTEEGYGSGRGKQVQGPAGVRPAERKQPVLCSWLQRNVRTPDFGSSDVLLEPAQTAVKSDNSLGWGSTATASLANGKADGGWKFRERLRVPALISKDSKTFVCQGIHRAKTLGEDPQMQPLTKL